MELKLVIIVGLIFLLLINNNNSNNNTLYIFTTSTYPIIYFVCITIVFTLSWDFPVVLREIQSKFNFLGAKQSVWDMWKWQITVQFQSILIATSQKVFCCGIFLELPKGLYDSG